MGRRIRKNHVVIEVCPPVDPARQAALLAGLRHEHAEADHVDPFSTLERIPTADTLTAAFRSADRALVALSASRDACGYGLTWSWVEDDGTRLHLLDVWAVPGPDQQRIEARLFEQLESAVRAQADVSSGVVVLGANCRSSEPARMRLLSTLGFVRTFDMVEMEASPAPLPRMPLPARVVHRAASRADGARIAALTAKVWAGRDYFTMPTVDDVNGWLVEADPDLYLLAENGTELVGLASATIRPQCAEIDDVQVHPQWQRQGVATGLLTELMARLAARTSLPIRLHTEGHDPAGARALYEHLGFTVVATHHRLRKAL